MSKVELYERIRRDRRVEPDVSIRELSRRYRVHRRDVRAALASPVPPPRKTPQRTSPALGPHEATIRRWLREDLDAARRRARWVLRGAGGAIPPAYSPVVVGFEHERDARRFADDLRQRLAKFGLELAEDKTRLVEFGRLAVANRRRRGLGRPETFAFLGFVHICSTTRNGKFLLLRHTIAKRMRTKLRELKLAIKRRVHLPIPAQGAWLASVVRGYYATTRCRRTVAR